MCINCQLGSWKGYIELLKTTDLNQFWEERDITKPEEYVKRGFDAEESYWICAVRMILMGHTLDLKKSHPKLYREAMKADNYLAKEPTSRYFLWWHLDGCFEYAKLVEDSHNMIDAVSSVSSRTGGNIIPLLMTLLALGYPDLVCDILTYCFENKVFQSMGTFMKVSDRIKRRDPRYYDREANFRYNDDDVRGRFGSDLRFGSSGAHEGIGEYLETRNAVQNRYRETEVVEEVSDYEEEGFMIAI